MPLTEAKMTSILHARAFDDARPLFPIPPVAGCDVLLRDERADDVAARERLLDAAFGGARFLKTCERLRANRRPAEGLSLTAEHDGALVGTIRLWHIDAGGVPALLLGPVAVSDSLRSAGIGRRLIAESLFRAVCRGHRAVILVGDAPYYERFGFSRSLTRGLVMPGPVEDDRFLGLELEPSSLSGARGLVTASGARILRVPAKARALAEAA
jgi:predicted N-acetyltransferase YhbS